MSPNELALVPQSQAVAMFPSEKEIAAMKDLGAMAIKSGFLPQSIKTPEQAVIILLKGRELGLPPMQSFSSIAVINGKPTISAELMLNLIYRNVPGAKINVIETNNDRCTIEATRPGGSPTRFTFSTEDAKVAGLLGKGPWVTYKAAMLRARCTSAMARMMFSDALAGAVYTPEEIEDEGRPGVPDFGSEKVALLNAKLGLAKPVEATVVEQPAAPVEVLPPEPVAAPQPAPAAWGADLPTGVAAPELPMQDDGPGSYVVPFGKENKGKRLDQCTDESIERTRNYLFAEQKKAPLSPGALEFLAASSHYLNWKQNAAMGDVP